MYLLINKTDLYASEVHKNKQTIIDKLSVNRRTLNKYIANKQELKGFIIMYTGVIKNKHKGRF